MITLMTFLAISCKKEKNGTCKIIKVNSNGYEYDIIYDEQERIIKTHTGYTISYTGNTSLKSIANNDTVISRTSITRNSNGYIINIHYEKMRPQANYDVRSTNWAYEYNGNQVKSAVYTQDYQNGSTDKYNYTYTWSGGNMIKEEYKEVGNNNVYTYINEYEYTDIPMQEAGYIWENTQYGTGLPIIQNKYLVKSRTSKTVGGVGNESTITYEYFLDNKGRVKDVTSLRSSDGNSSATTYTYGCN